MSDTELYMLRGARLELSNSLELFLEGLEGTSDERKVQFYHALHSMKSDIDEVLDRLNVPTELVK